MTESAGLVPFRQAAWDAVVTATHRWLGGRPDDVALVADGRTLTFGQLDERADRVAAGLLAAGCRPGDRLLALLPSGTEVYELLLGCARAGLVFVPLNWRLTVDELLPIARNAGAAALVVGEAFAATGKRLAAETAGRLVLKLDDFDYWVARQYRGFPRREAHARDVVLQVYTSGTSGVPKGVLLTDGNLATKVSRAATSWGLDEHAVSLLATPLFHVGGLGWGLAGLHSGARTIIAGSAAPTELIITFRAERVTHSFLVPTMIERVCALAGDAHFPDLKAIVYGAAAIDPRTRRAAADVFGCRLLHVYGLSETTGAITQLDSETVDPMSPRAGSVGQPYPWVEVSIRDRVEMPVPNGQSGEIWTRSGQNTPGYHRNPGATLDLFGPDGWLRTGDGGYLDEDGYLFVTHRIKELIISGGENIHPGEVEEVLRGHPDVADVVVLGLPDRQWGEVVAAAVVVRAGRTLTPETLVAFAAARLAGYKRPRLVFLVPSLPRTATGKVRKHVLLEQLERS
jgi:long-chain acyl-CoA synthetase